MEQLEAREEGTGEGEDEDAVKNCDKTDEPKTVPEKEAVNNKPETNNQEFDGEVKKDSGGESNETRGSLQRQVGTRSRNGGC